VTADPGRHRSTTRSEDDPAWLTFSDAEYIILAVARTLTSAYRLLEAVQWFRDDFRIRLVFTIDESSAFSTGVRDLLSESGVRLVEWSRIQEHAFKYHLALTASENIDFSAIDTHTILLPHGLGFNKLVPGAHGSPLRLAGLPPEPVIRAGRVTIALSHAEQRDQLHAVDPDAASRTEIVGDPTFDRLQASRGLRTRYREAWGTGDRTLIAVASTWGRQSVIGRWHALPAQLLAALETDSYQVAVIMHPNVWAYYGELQISLWLSAALDAGLVLVPPESGWHAALIAADQVITDHGSLGLFAAALDKPLLMTGHATETVADTPVDALARSVGLLRSGDDLRRQLDDVRTRHAGGEYDDITGRVFDRVGDATNNVRSLIYRRLGLPPPAHTPSVTRIPVPHCHFRPITSYTVGTAQIKHATLTLERVPAAVWHHRAEAAHHDTHVVACDTELDSKILERAAVVTNTRCLERAAARSWGHSTLTALPGARLAVTATPTGCLAVVRDGTVIVADTPPADPARVQAIGSALYCWLIGPRVENERLTIHAGITTFTASFTVDR